MWHISDNLNILGHHTSTGARHTIQTYLTLIGIKRLECGEMRCRVPHPPGSVCARRNLSQCLTGFDKCTTTSFAQHR
ncbi:hypothetical protein K443DRAFT_464935 [Laccaria amethystina LaAM-08-1]|uniref:Uncharacterized protein n=1 Tax=Laccaria amethystina LaAM-08-1 TaxID=1095629 RepID=A0A0C9XPY8_9AGAR|nr:hypothetical protein K443DRAFT_464935 [Laccaria amethystina LaAM-08-1]